MEGISRTVRSLASPLAHAPLGAFTLILAAGYFGFGSYRGFVILTLVIYAISALGLNLPVGYSGVLSIGHGAAFAVGTYAVAITAGTHGAPLWVALPVALACGTLAGLVMGAPAARLGGVGLAMVSLGFTLVLADLVRAFDSFTNGERGIGGIRARVGFGDDATALGNRGVCVVAVAVLLMAYLTNWYFRASSIGRAAVAANNDSIGAQAAGVSTYRTQLLTFAIGSGIGAVAGGINAYVVSFVNPSSVNIDTSFLFLAMVVLGGAGSRVGPLVGAAVLGGLPIWLAKYPNLNVIVYALILLLIVRLRPRGVVSETAVAVALNRTDFEDAAAPGVSATVVDEPAVRCVGITKSFGGVQALVGVDLVVGPGTVEAIIGPNGSGKTTLLNVMSGYYESDSGRIEVNGRELAERARRHLPKTLLSRTFQTPRTFGDLSPLEHLDLANARSVGGGSEGADGTPFRRLALSLFEVIGEPFGEIRRAANLSHGQLRFLEIAFAIARAPRVLLLDEPATGLSANEIDLLCETIEQVAKLGCAVVLVEHHLELVDRIADHVTVLNLGAVLWAGPPDELASSQVVRDTYLGVGV